MVRINNDVSAEAAAGAMTLAELGRFVDAARQAGVSEHARLSIRSRGSWRDGAVLRRIRTLAPARPDTD